MAFEAKERTVEKLLNDAIYYIPRNQRRYVWTEQNWIDLYEDILLVADDVASSHFIGSIVLKDEGKVEGLSKYTVIDGQQRILTLTIFLSAIMFVMKKRNMLDDFGGTKKYLIAKNIKNSYREIVYPEYHLSLPKIVEIITNDDNHDINFKDINSFIKYCTISKSKDKNIIEAFKFFVTKLDIVDNEKLLKIRDALIEINYVEIISSSEEDSYTIFEILNARGLDLEDYELLKNYIMRYLHPIELRDDAKSTWEIIEQNLVNGLKPFLRHYAIHKYNYDKKKGISVYKSITTATKGRNVDKLLDDIRIKSTYYARILCPNKEYFEEYDIFSYFARNRVEQFRPLILSVMHQYEEGNISQEKYRKILDFLYTFYICYKIIGEENSNKLSDTVFKYAYIIENDFSQSKLDECINAFKTKLPTIDSCCGIVNL